MQIKECICEINYQTISYDDYGDRGERIYSIDLEDKEKPLLISILKLNDGEILDKFNELFGINFSLNSDCRDIIEGLST